MELDPISAVVAPDPYPYYDELARRGLFYDERLQLWIAADAASVTEAFAHPACRVRPPAEPVPAAFADSGAGELFGSLVRFNEGPQRHDVPKRAIAAALASVADETVVESTLATAARPRERDALDFVNDWMFAVPVATVAALLGTTNEDLPQSGSRIAAYLEAIAPGATPAHRAAGSVAARELIERFATTLDPADGRLAGAVMREAAVAGWTDRHQIAANLAGFLAQTYDATAALIGNAILRVRRDRDVERVLDAPELSFEELVADTMRDDPPVHNTRRFVAEDATIGGIVIPAGSQILLVLAAAGRGRGALPGGFGFGSGSHACPGAKIARTIASCALERLFATHETAWTAQLRWTYRSYPNIRSPHFTA